MPVRKMPSGTLWRGQPPAVPAFDPKAMMLSVASIMERYSMRSRDSRVSRVFYPGSAYREFFFSWVSHGYPGTRSPGYQQL